MRWAKALVSIGEMLLMSTTVLPADKPSHTPFLPNNTSVERDLAPLWSLWRAEKNEQNGKTSQSLLWNLYRRDTSPDARKCSLLFGLIQYQSDPDGRRWRVGYVPFGKKKTSAEPSHR